MTPGMWRKRDSSLLFENVKHTSRERRRSACGRLYSFV
jgi:hypothetical protein